MVVARSCGLTAVSYFLAQLLVRKPNSVRQQLREFCYDAPDKRGARRQQLEVESCFAGLLGWILKGWQSRQLALALDATSLGARFGVLALSVVYRGCAIPVAWKVLPANRPHSWKPEWLRLLRGLRCALPKSMTVIVLADRGLYARWLFQQIVRLGWHPLLRVNAGGKFRPAGSRVFRSLASFAPRVGTRWSGPGSAFAKVEHRLECTLLACWEEGYREAWLILTDLPAAAAQAGWYGLRAWIEQGFKITKRGGWQWQRTRLDDPKRAARLGLAVAVATLWLLSVGGAAESTVPDSTLLDLRGVLAEQKRQRRATRLRLVSIFRQGWAALLVALINRTRLPKGYFKPEPWPELQPKPT
jgi:hypothetical protein